jgi:hypothetical protein
LSLRTQAIIAVKVPIAVCRAFRSLKGVAQFPIGIKPAKIALQSISREALKNRAERHEY